jgi:DNA-directed RNA polymerase specialized sigma24 family protein
MPDEERELFDLLWYYGLSPAEAARVLDIPEHAVMGRWQTARVRLHDGLEGDAPR